MSRCFKEQSGETEFAADQGLVMHSSQEKIANISEKEEIGTTKTGTSATD